MTKEIAIEMCQAIDQYLCAGNPIWNTEVIHEAMTMAIEALKAEKTGEWIERRLTSKNGCTYRIIRCSECGFVCHYSDDVYGGGYCPSCGSRMVNDETD